MEEFMLPPFAYRTQDYEIYLFKHNLKQELNKQLEKYISTLKHDIKTPVLAQIHAIEHLLTESKERFNKNQQDILTSILESCNTQYAIINDLINIMKYKQEQIVLKQSSFDIVQMLKDIIQETPHPNLKLECDKISVRADKEKIYAALSKVFKYIFNQPLKISATKVTVSQNKYNSHVTIKIYNDNANCNNGFSYKNGEKVFINSEAYNSVGSDLELQLVSAILNAHNGELIIKSHGNIRLVKIRLPLK